MYTNDKEPLTHLFVFSWASKQHIWLDVSQNSRIQSKLYIIVYVPMSIASKVCKFDS
jgi:hypothetical protein